MGKQQDPNAPNASDEEVEQVLLTLRAVNAKAAVGEITWDERVRIHQVLSPEIGNLGGLAARGSFASRVRRGERNGRQRQ